MRQSCLSCNFVRTRVVTQKLSCASHPEINICGNVSAAENILRKKKRINCLDGIRVRTGHGNLESHGILQLNFSSLESHGI